MEIWKEVIGFENYLISNHGNIKSTRFNKIKSMKIGDHRCGYKKIGLRNSSGQFQKYIHQLVAIHFINNPNDLYEVNHINENKHDNYYLNLEWVTRSENMQHSFAKKVIQTDLDGNFIKEWESTNSVKKFGFSQGNVMGCCSGKRSKHKGFKWKFKD